MTTRITLFFEPLDVLQFRDHRPFDAGMHHVASSVFPRPTVFRGAVRTALFRALGARFDASDPYFGVLYLWARQWLGGRDDPGELSLRGPVLARLSPDGFAALFHAPHDLVWQEGNGSRAQLLVPLAMEADIAPQRFRWRSGSLQQVASALAWTSEEIGKQGFDEFLTEAGAAAYLAVQHGTLDLAASPEDPPRSVPRASVLQQEARVGLVRSPEQLTAADRMIYTITPFRLAAGVGFAVDVTLPEAAADEARALLGQLEGRRAPLGGKAHGARIRVLDAPLPMLVDPFEPVADSACPRKFWLQTSFPLKEPNPPGLTIIARRTETVGGFDLQKGIPRPLRAALPAGTVLHYAGSLSDLAADADLRTGYGTALLASPSHGVMS